jgi:hypothetical protein
MADHPWPRSRKTFATTFGFLDKPRRLARTTSTARTMRRFVLIKCLGRVRAAFIGGVRLAPLRRHAKEIRRSQNRARRGAFALRAILRGVTFGHWPHVGKRTAVVTKIIIDRHFITPRCKTLGPLRMRGGRPQMTVPHPSQGDLFVLRKRHLDVTLDVFDRTGRRRHDIEIEDFGR